MPGVSYNNRPNWPYDQGHGKSDRSEPTPDSPDQPEPTADQPDTSSGHVDATAGRSVNEGKRPGRPPLTPGDTSTPVTVRLPSKLFDRACTAATQQRMNVRDVIRRAVERDLAPPSST